MKGQDSFHARFAGRCAVCGKSYRRGANVWSPKPKGGLRTQSAGLCHIKCQPPVTTRQATEEEILDVKLRAEKRRTIRYLH